MLTSPKVGGQNDIVLPALDEIPHLRVRATVEPDPDLTKRAICSYLDRYKRAVRVKGPPAKQDHALAVDDLTDIAAKQLDCC